ncbi:TonB-dependent receptor [Sphingomonas daechungensis]|uniref:TonB-dependent receptor n=1 Tax=Sphingomonas daechungensis TaxID=1176646 RepID=A0ABX6SYR0_9SPHN|nr:TonB-dependent receptor [Sphingomonas daechungensis]
MSTSGPAGSLTEVRIRGSENNHTLLFVDGIRANDPATGNQPRFELLNSDLASRIEVVRGPQSALWGSEAVGGVVAVNGLAARGSSYAVGFEGGSFGFLRGSASGSIASEQGDLSAGIGWQKASGIDAFDGNGDKDGYRNLSARVRGSWTLGPGVKLGAAAFSLSGEASSMGTIPTRLSSIRIHSTAAETASALLAYGLKSGRRTHPGAAVSAVRSSPPAIATPSMISSSTGRRGHDPL